MCIVIERLQELGRVTVASVSRSERKDSTADSTSFMGEVCGITRGTKEYENGSPAERANVRSRESTLVRCFRCCWW